MRDNGKGISKINNTGLGMKNIELRMQMLQTLYRFKTNCPKGTTFIFALENRPSNEIINQNNTSI